MKKIFKLIITILLVITSICMFTGCSSSQATTQNIETEIEKFKIYRKITFVNLCTGELLYSAEGYFSIKSNYTDSSQEQRELTLVFKTDENQYKMNKFSIAEDICYVIEQTENTSNIPYYYNLIWYATIPNISN